MRAELVLAALFDKNSLAPYLMSGLAGALTGMGLDACTLLQHGLPPYVPDLLLRAFGAWDTTLWAAGFTAAALPVTAWALRAWWRANMQLLGGAAGVIQQHLQQEQQQQNAAVQHQDSSSSSSHWVAAGVTVLRGLCLASAANSFITLLYRKGASTAAAAITGGSALAAAAVAVASIVLLQQHSNSSSSPSSSSSSHSQPVLLPLLAAEAAWVAAMLGVSPLVSAAAAVVLAGSLFLLHQGAVSPALQQYRAAAGDTVEVHVGLKLAGTRPLFDSTISEEPIRLQVSRVPQETLQLWEAAASADLSSRHNQQGDAAGDGSSSSTAAAGSDSEAPIVTASLADVQRDIQGWVARPMARWEALRPFIAHASNGLYLGETLSVPLYNPKVVGYWNPNFTWWQPSAEVLDKFKGNMPEVGDVFWYPVADGAAVPTRVNAVGRDYVELDANYGVTDTALELQVQLVRLLKQAQ